MALLRKALLALLGLALFAVPASAKDEPRIVAVGDLHGDYNAYLDIVEEAGLVDSKGRWKGGDTIFVQTGDVADRGPDSLKIIRSLQKLQEEAPKSGGRVVALIGNHEAMNVTGDLRYVDPGEYEAFKNRDSATLRDRVFEANRESLETYYRQLEEGIDAKTIKERWMADNPLGKIEHRLAWAPAGEIGKWVVALPTIAEIQGIIFVHGGISVETAETPIDEINDEVRSEVAKGESYSYSILTDELGPLWYRGNVVREPDNATPAEGETPPPERPSIEAELDTILAAYHADRLVVGHTPSLTGILADWGGKLIRIDTGNSAYYGGPHSFLEIEDGKAIAHSKGKDGKWSVAELPTPPGVGQ